MAGSIPAAPTMKYNTHELAWAAGFFDGEGSLVLRHQVVHRKSGTYEYMRPLVSIGQVDPEVLHRFRKAVGVGFVDGPYQTKHRDVWKYRAQKFEEVQMVMILLWPWASSIKREQMRNSFINRTKVQRAVLET